MVAVALFVFSLPVLTRRFGWSIRWPSMTARILYVGAYTLAWAFGDLGLIPRWVESIAEAGVIVAYWFAPNDDDDHRRRKGRLRAAWRRTREYLARGIVAPAPEVG